MTASFAHLHQRENGKIRRSAWFMDTPIGLAATTRTMPIGSETARATSDAFGSTRASVECNDAVHLTGRVVPILEHAPDRRYHLDGGSVGRWRLVGDRRPGGDVAEVVAGHIGDEQGHTGVELFPAGRGVGQRPPSHFFFPKKREKAMVAGLGGGG